MRVNQQAAFVLHRQAYSNTSLLVDVFTEDYGRFRLIAKGVRNAKSPRKALLQPFVPIIISWSGKSDLKTLTAIELNTAWVIDSFRGNTLFNGMYVNELLMKLLYPSDPHPEVYALYQQTLQTLSLSSEQAFSLRLFEFQLLEMLGYSLGLDTLALATSPEQWYTYHHEHGLIAAAPTASSPHHVQAKYLQSLVQAQPCDAHGLQQLKQFMRYALLNRLEGKTIQSRRMYL